MSLVKVLFCFAPRGTLLLLVSKLACFVLFKALNLTICILLPLFVSALALVIDALVFVKVGVGDNRLLLLKELLVNELLAHR